jgi:hypothetical protein
MAANVPAVRDRVQRILTRLLGSVQVGADGEFSFDYESTRVFIRVEPWQDQATIVSVYAITNIDVPSSLELFRFVAGENTWFFGHLAAQEVQDGKVTVVFRHTLLGDYLDPEELRTAVAAVASTADQVDDVIQQQFGGSRVADL